MQQAFANDGILAKACLLVLRALRRGRGYQLLSISRILW